MRKLPCLLGKSQVRLVHRNFLPYIVAYASHCSTILLWVLYHFYTCIDYFLGILIPINSDISENSWFQFVKL
jgi:hypothetical protein